MALKVVRTFSRPATPYEQEVLSRIGAEMVVASNMPGRCTEDELLTLVRDADAVVSVFEPFTRRVIENLSRCRILLNIGVGYQNIDVRAATDHGICVVNNPEYCLEEVSDHALALLLALARKILWLDKAVKAGKTEYTDIAQARGEVYRLKGRTLGLVGFGRIPRTLVPKAKGFGFRIIAYDPYVPKGVAQGMGVELVDLERLLSESDFVSVHCALTPENHHMIGLEQFKKMKRTAFFINTARGELVDPEALYSALSQRLIAGAGLDVTEPEPINADNPLLKLDNVILTGHSAFFSVEAVEEQWKRPVEEIARVFRSEWPLALVNPQVKAKFTQRWGQAR